MEKFGRRVMLGLLSALGLGAVLPQRSKRDEPKPKLHMYGNYVRDYFAAESLEEAKRLAFYWYIDECQMHIDDCWEDIREMHPIDDDRVLTFCGEDGGEAPIAKPALHWAVINGKGFWATTEC